LKGHGFPAVPQVFENDVRRGLKPRPFKAQPLIPTFFSNLSSAKSTLESLFQRVNENS
jgi:hypothetical protein